MIVFNYRGLIMVVAAIVIAFGAGSLFGFEDEGRLMLVMGPLTVLFDLAYRLTVAGGHWLYPSQGGSLFFVPAWTLGVLWIVLGIERTVG
jgi:hypothetical protein